MPHIADEGRHFISDSRLRLRRIALLLCLGLLSVMTLLVITRSSYFFSSTKRIGEPSKSQPVQVSIPHSTVTKQPRAVKGNAPLGNESKIVDLAHGPQRSVKAMNYVDRVVRGLTIIEEDHIQPDPKSKVPTVRRPPPNICFASQFDAVRSPMTLEELLSLLGEPYSRQNYAGDTMCWNCEDGRGLNVRPNYSNDPKQTFTFRESELQTIKYAFPDSGRLQMTLYRGAGKVRFFVIPPRKPGEVEEAIKKVGPRKNGDVT